MSRLCLALLLCCSACLAARSSGGGNYGRGGGGNYGRGGGYGTQTHSYPSSTGYSGNRPTGTQTHSYPSSNGMSGNRNTGGSYHRTEVHHHYHYNPPQQIHYGSQQLPVYHHPPPVYVYEYRNSGSRFDTLLTGLALYNLGKMSTYHDRYDDRYRDYRPSSGETCKLGIKKTNGDYEETRIDCKLMSSFIWEADQDKTSNTDKKVITNTSITTVTNVTHLNLNTSDSDNSTNTGVTVTVTNTTTVVDALSVKGPSIDVKPGMTCYMIRISPYSSTLKRHVDCGILQTYAVQSLHGNAVCFKSMYIVTAILSFVIFRFS